MVLPLALGPAVAASAAVLKAKCTFLAGANATPACISKTGQEKGAPENKTLHVDTHASRSSSVHDETSKRSATPRSEHLSQKQTEASAPRTVRSDDMTSHEQERSYRQLIDDAHGTHRAHRGLHATGSVFVSSVDSTNAGSFFMGGNPFKAVLITETSSTPQWFKELASKHHSICAFGEARCTDGMVMKMLGISMTEDLPICIVATSYPAAVQRHMYTYVSIYSYVGLHSSDVIWENVSDSCRT